MRGSYAYYDPPMSAEPCRDSTQPFTKFLLQQTQCLAATSRPTVKRSFAIAHREILFYH